MEKHQYQRQRRKGIVPPPIHLNNKYIVQKKDVPDGLQGVVKLPKTAEEIRMK